ncbi:MAG: DUF2333 family protein [Gammaproteobacteria bacterium]
MRLTNGVKRLANTYNPSNWRGHGWLWKIAVILITLVILLSLLGMYWSREPGLGEPAGARTSSVTGFATTSALSHAANTLLNKPGGYLSNDIMPPGAFLDNMPNWEFGVLVQMRDLARALRNDFSRSQTQSVEDEDLIITEPQFNFSNDSWMFPATESEYQTGLDALERYLARLTDSNQRNAQFYARADNLQEWLGLVEKRLGSLSQRLTAAVGQSRLNTDLAGEENAEQSTETPSQLVVKTPWMQIDDVFYEARGMTWALIHFLKAVEIDFNQTLQKKNAVVSLRQIIRELEASQGTIWSPMILNGGGFGFVANHSLVMASYVSRANAAVIDLRQLLMQG